MRRLHRTIPTQTSIQKPKPKLMRNWSRLSFARPMQKQRQLARFAAPSGIAARPDRLKRPGRCNAAPRTGPPRATAPRQPPLSRSHAATAFRATRRPVHRAAECRYAEPGAKTRALAWFGGRRGRPATPIVESRLEASRAQVLKRVWGSGAGTHRRCPSVRSSARSTRKTRDAPSAVRAAHVLRAELRPRRKACCVSPSFARQRNCTAKRYGIQLFAACHFVGIAVRWFRDPRNAYSRALGSFQTHKSPQKQHDCFDLAPEVACSDRPAPEAICLPGLAPEAACLLRPHPKSGMLGQAAPQKQRIRTRFTPKEQHRARRPVPRQNMLLLGLLVHEYALFGAF